MQTNAIGEICQENTMNYKRYEAALRKCLGFARESYFHQLFDDTKQSIYNLWKCLGPVFNPTKTKKTKKTIIN